MTPSRPSGPTAAGVLIAGTTSGAGKSFVATGLCRLLSRRGWLVRPYKAANMSLNSVPAEDGGEMAAAQALQCLAASSPVVTASNPILYKTEGPGRVEVIVRGRVRWRVGAWSRQMPRLAPGLAREARKALNETRATGAFVVAEGAGSPVEVNLQRTDLANLRVARWLDAPVILVADLERGGALAQIVGTLALLSSRDRARVRGLILNRMRGDASLLAPAVRFLEHETGRPVLGVLPFLSPSVARLPPEDSLDLSPSHVWSVRRRGGKPRVVVVRLPHASNYSDFTPLERVSTLEVRWADSPAEAKGARAVILPGTRRTVDDLAWMRATGWDRTLRTGVARGLRILGVCGGYQVLGRELVDPQGFEGPPGKSSGLALLPMSTNFANPKLVRHVKAHPMQGHPCPLPAGPFPGFEIRRGVTRLRRGGTAAFQLETTDTGATAWELDGCVARQGRIWGTAVHGLFQSPAVVEAFARWVGLQVVRGRSRGAPSPKSLEGVIDAVADLLEAHLDLKELGEILGRPLVVPGASKR